MAVPIPFGTAKDNTKEPIKKVNFFCCFVPIFAQNRVVCPIVTLRGFVKRHFLIEPAI